MKKVTKLKDNKYLSTKTIVHGNKQLSTFLEKIPQLYKIENLSIAVGETYQNNLIKNAKLVIVEFTFESSWSMHTIHTKSNYSLNTYNSESVGSISNFDAGTIKFQYGSTNFVISELVIIK